MVPLTPDQLDPTGDVRTLAQDAGALDHGSSRRDVLKGAGVGVISAAGISSLFGAMSPLDAFAAVAGTTGAYSTTRRSAANDVKIGNYALALEYLEAAFYEQAHESGTLNDPDISGFAGKLASHEAAHVKALKGVLGRKAISSPTVDFGDAVKDQNTFMKTAAQLEPVGTAAYGGAGPYISSLPIVKAALSIHSVEANHAAWAASLLKYKNIDPNADPAPNSFNKPFSFAKTVSAVTKTGFVKGKLQP